MADEDDMLLFVDFIDNTASSERLVLTRSNPFDEYDDKKFRERFRLSKSTVSRLLDEVSYNNIMIMNTVCRRPYD